MEKHPLFDVLVIGGGVVGCAVAREVSRYSLNVALFEKAEDICTGQSKANSGIVHGGYDNAPHSLKAKYNVLGNAMYPALCRDLQVPFRQNGSLVLAFSRGEIQPLRELMQRGEENGVPGMEIITQEALRQKEKNVSSEAVAALWAPSAGSVCPYELTIAYAENAAANGAKFYRNAGVNSVEREDGLWRVATTCGVFYSRCVVNCAGVHADEINNMVSEDRFSIAPWRGEYHIVDKNYRDAFTSTIFQLPTHLGKGILIAPTVEGTTLIGPSAEIIEDKEDKRSTAKQLEYVTMQAKRSWPALPTRSFICTYTGLRAHCDRNDFVIGEAVDAKLFFNAAGIESPGLTAAPAIAHELAAQIAQRLEANVRKDFNPVRVSIPKFREMDDALRAAAIAASPDFARIVCRCETVSEAEIREAIRRPVGARTVDGIKRRTRAGMGRCQAGFCLQRTIEILAEELNVPQSEVSKCGGESKYIFSSIFTKGGECK